jgi:hypothetical protein
MEDPGPLCAAHTPNFPLLLRRLGASLLVTTYQAGKLVMVRDEGDHLNTHYRTFQAPMGLALADGGARLAIGTTLQVWEFRDVPNVARRLEPAGRHDACFLRRGETIALLKFTSGVQKVFTVALSPRRFPDLINNDEKLLESSFVVPTECLSEVAATVRANANAD